MRVPPAALLIHFAHAFPGVQSPVVTTGPGARVWIAAAPNGIRVVNLVAPDLDAHVAFRLSIPGEAPRRTDVIGMPLPPWALYAAAVGWGWAAQGHTVPGLDAVILAEQGVQEGFVWETGLAFAAVWQDVGGWPTPPGGLLGLMMHLGGYFHQGAFIEPEDG